MHYRIPQEALREDLKHLYPNGTTTARLIIDGHRTATTRKPFGEVGETFYIEGVPGTWRITLVHSINLISPAGCAAWEKEKLEGWDADWIMQNKPGQVYQGAIQTVFASTKHDH